LRNTLKEILRKTIRNLEQRSEISSDDPNLAEMKKTLQIMIAGLELAESPKQEGTAMEELSSGDMYVTCNEERPVSVGRTMTRQCRVSAGGRPRHKRA
jgi:hypothetical protein